MIKELGSEESKKFLGEQRVARLGCVLPSGEPYVVPVNYLFRNGSIFIHSAPGLKVEALRANPKACLQVDRVENTFKWRSVIAFGESEEITVEAERKELLREFATSFQNLTPADAVKPAAAGGASEVVVLFRIRIERITGVNEN